MTVTVEAGAEDAANSITPRRREGSCACLLHQSLLHPPVYNTPIPPDERSIRLWGPFRFTRSIRVVLSERNLRIAAAVLALAGIGVATYIAIAESGGGAPKCLAGGSGCETVANSQYSHLAGINVAVIGIVGYVAAAR